MSKNSNKKITSIINNRFYVIGAKPGQKPVNTETEWDFLRRMQQQVDAVLPPEGPQDIHDVDAESKRIILQHQASCLVRNFGWLFQWSCVITCTVIIAKFVWHLF